MAKKKTKKVPSQTQMSQAKGGRYGGRPLLALPRQQFNNIARILLGVAVTALGIFFLLQPYFLQDRLAAWHYALFSDVSVTTDIGVPKLTAANDDSFYLDAEKATGWSRDFYRKIIPATEWNDEDYEISHYSDGTLFADVQKQLPPPSHSYSHETDYRPAYTQYEWEFDNVTTPGSYVNVSLSVDDASGQIIEKRVYYYE